MDTKKVIQMARETPELLDKDEIMHLAWATEDLRRQNANLNTYHRKEKAQNAGISFGIATAIFAAAFGIFCFIYYVGMTPDKVRAQKIQIVELQEEIESCRESSVQALENLEEKHRQNFSGLCGDKELVIRVLEPYNQFTTRLKSVCSP